MGFSSLLSNQELFAIKRFFHNEPRNDQYQFQNDAEICGKIGYEAHKAISSAHDYPSEQPSEEFGIGLIRRLLGNPNSWDVLAERQAKTLGGIFLHKFPPSHVAVIGHLQSFN
jgi:hypothetical protein